jgi:hypothetical protein
VSVKAEEAPTVDRLIVAAVEAWVGEGLGVTPRRIRVLKGPGRKSTVLRLYGVGYAGTSVIAKRCPISLARIEQTVYEEVLAALPVTSLRLYGTSAQGAHGWLFIEDAGETKWSPATPEHRALASEWLAAVHIGALDLVSSVDLPLRDADYYLALVRSAKEVVADGLTNDVIDGSAQRVLRTLAEDCTQLEERWSEVETLWARFPRTLTLPGMGRDNSCVRATPHGPSFAPFDFESAGWGVPAAELWQLDLDRYLRATAPVWRLESRDLERIAAIGGGLFSIKSIGGEVATLSSPWPWRALRKLTFYAKQVASGLSALESCRGGSRG